MEFYKKRYIKLFIYACLLMGCWITNGFSVSAQEQELEKFGFDITTLDGNCVYTVNWWQQMFPNENEYYISVPCSEQGRDIRVNFLSDSDVYLNGEKIENGQVVSQLGAYNTLSCAGQEYRLNVIYGSDIAALHITTKSGNIENVYEDKNYKEPAYARIIENGNVIHEGRLEYIKGRGNSTWDSSKKPFNIKFEEKMNLFDMGSAKKWCLLANYKDDTALKNKLGYDFAQMVEFAFYPESVFVDLYIDNEYIGHYLLCERVEIRKDRINITDLEELNEKANPEIDFKKLELGGTRGTASVFQQGSSKWVDLPNNPENINGGYLLEFELPARYDSEKCGFVTDYGQPIIINSPEYASEEQVEYISNFYQEFEDAVISGDGYNDKGKHYSEYIDVESVAKMYVFQEYIKNIDGASTSLFFYKNTAGKLTAGPVWDVDLAFGVDKEKNGIDFSDPNGKWITGSYLQHELSDKCTIFTLLCRHNDFREEAKRQWEFYFKPNVEDLRFNLDSLYRSNYVSIVIDKCKWSMDNSGIDDVIERYDENVSLLEDFIEQRSTFLDELFSDEICYIEYNSNGGQGVMTDLENYHVGTTIKLEENIYEKEDKEFLGWNTKASGWGQNYKNKDEIVLKSDLTLYAQWETITFKDKIKNFVLGIMGN